MTARRHPRRGVALMLSLVMILLLTVLVVGYVYEAQVETVYATNAIEQYEAYLAARSAVMLGLRDLDLDLIQKAGNPAIETLHDTWAAYADPDLLLAENLTPQVNATELNGAMLAYTISDEYGKIPLNALIYQESQEPNPLVAQALAYLLTYRGAEVPLEEPIIDWVDGAVEGGAITRSGAERDYYEALPEAYTAQDRPMDAIEQLLLVADMDPDLFFGDREEGMLPLGELLTVHGHPQGYVNLYTAPEEVLIAYADAMTATSGATVDVYRLLNERRDFGQNARFQARDDLVRENIIAVPEPWQPQNELSPIPGSEETLGLPIVVNPFTVSSNVFRIRGFGVSAGGDAKAIIDCFVYRDITGEQDRFRILDWRVVQ